MPRLLASTSAGGDLVDMSAVGFVTYLAFLNAISRRSMFFSKVACAAGIVLSQVGWLIFFHNISEPVYVCFAVSIVVLFAATMIHTFVETRANIMRVDVRAPENSHLSGRSSITFQQRLAILYRYYTQKWWCWLVGGAILAAFSVAFGVAVVVEEAPTATTVEDRSSSIIVVILLGLIEYIGSLLTRPGSFFWTKGLACFFLSIQLICTVASIYLNGQQLKWMVSIMIGLNLLAAVVLFCSQCGEETNKKNRRRFLYLWLQKQQITEPLSSETVDNDHIDELHEVSLDDIHNNWRSLLIPWVALIAAIYPWTVFAISLGRQEWWVTTLAGCGVCVLLLLIVCVITYWVLRDDSVAPFTAEYETTRNSTATATHSTSSSTDAASSVSGSPFATRSGSEDYSAEERAGSSGNSDVRE